MRSRRGFTLIELVIGLMLGLMVGGLVHSQLLRSGRAARAQTERTAMQENVRVAALVLAGELGGIGYDEITPGASTALGYPAAVRSDLLAIAPGAVTYLAGRGSGHVCAVAPGPLGAIVVEQSSWISLRAPRATDSLLVFVESDTASAADDAWIHLGVVSAVGATCPDGASATEIRIAVPPPLDPGALAGIASGAPVRLAEIMQMRYYKSGGQSWLGMRSVSTGEAITPVAGPLADSTAGVRGLTLRYRDAADAPTSDPAAVRAIEIALLGVTSQPVHGRDLRLAVVDSFALTLRVAPRNAPRP
jgi:prepilin-type N-terminal cleavage/methylation domain-containing protein